MGGGIMGYIIVCTAICDVWICRNECLDGWTRGNSARKGEDHRTVRSPGCTCGKSDRRPLQATLGKMGPDQRSGPRGCFSGDPGTAQPETKPGSGGEDHWQLKLNWTKVR
ncbi:uncharacterized protein H6S33_010066 [Morchella sextelata]|uniref:uncharacterized protein n=1 Tax=Morchella sextelata TaxID=1174677 RepID=UPI001D0564A2|nr:uncharacterized protein H6S33_010066 [Morchella sextelata]KAH0612014.1 hypothetical protein H6S33_010066 [Morchella sextelata]